MLRFLRRFRQPPHPIPAGRPPSPAAARNGNGAAATRSSKPSTRPAISEQGIFYLNATLSVLQRERVRLATRQVVHGRPARGARFLEIPIYLDREMVRSLSMQHALKDSTLRAIRAVAGVDAVNAWQQRNAIVYQYQLAHQFWKFYKRTDLPSPDGIGLGVGRSLVPFQLNNRHTLVAGETRSGKSVTIESILFAIMQSHRPDEVGLVLIDPNQTFGIRKDGLSAGEVGRFTNAAHLLRPVAHSYEQIDDAINYVYGEWKRRTRNGIQDAPGIVLVIDELMSEAVIGDRESGSHHAEHLEKLTQLASQGIKNNIFLVVGAQDPRVSNTSGLFMRNLGLRFIGQVTDGAASRALAGQSGVNAHLLTGNGDFVRVGKGNGDQHTRFQVAEPTRADFNRLERRPVRATPVAPAEIINPPPPEPDEVDATLLFPDDEEAPEADEVEVCVDALTLAIYFHEKQLSVRQARARYGIVRRAHQEVRQFARDLEAEVKSLRAGNPPNSPYYQKLLQERDE
jgi:hypothetical protein